MFDELLAAMNKQEQEDFAKLNELYDSFLTEEEAGNSDKAMQIHKQIAKLEKEMGLR